MSFWPLCAPAFATARAHVAHVITRCHSRCLHGHAHLHAHVQCAFVHMARSGCARATLAQGHLLAQQVVPPIPTLLAWGVLWWCSPFCTTRGLLLCWASKDPTNRPLANERCSAAVITPHGGRLPTVARLACVSAFTGVGSPHVPRPARGTNVPLACGRPRFVFPPGAQRRLGVAWRCCTRP